MTVLALRIFLAPLFVVFASFVVRRFGVRTGGVVAGIPAVAGPILLVIALQQGTAFASTAASGALLGMVGLATFIFAYVTTARLFPWSGALAAAYTAFALPVVALQSVSVGAFAALVIACAALAGVLALLPKAVHGSSSPSSTSSRGLVFRAACTTLVVVGVTTIAPTLGPHLSGLVTSTPVVTAVLVAFTHAQRGRDEASRLLRGFALGFFSYAAFCLVVATTIRRLGIAQSFGLAVATTALVQTATVFGSYWLAQVRRAEGDTVLPHSASE